MVNELRFLFDFNFYGKIFVKIYGRFLQKLIKIIIKIKNLIYFGGIYNMGPLRG
jgi:hypothetical protein